MRKWDIVRGWGRVLEGYKPVLSIEITKECPLSCPGCYAFQPGHLGGVPLTSLADRTGDRLVEGIEDLIRRHRPLVVYLVGGEPLVRFRELNTLLPRICGRPAKVEMVTSAVRPLPRAWAELDDLRIVVSIDGLQPEHDERRKPATYHRILQHIEGHRITVHCTLTAPMLERPGYLDEFVEFWSQRSEVTTIWVSFYTPQVGETSREILDMPARRRAVRDLVRLSRTYPKLSTSPRIVETYLDPPRSPQDCMFARITHCVSADLKTPVTPCQLGGNPDCSNCGCLASIALHMVGHYPLPGGVSGFSAFDLTDRIGNRVKRVRRIFARNGSRRSAS